MPHDLKTLFSRSQIVGYVAAVAGVILATAATPLIAWITGGYIPPLLYIPIIVAAAAVGGLLPGLLATALGAVAALLFLFEQDGFDVADPKDHIRLAFLIGTGILVSWVLELAFRQRRRIDAQREQLRVTLASIGDGVVRTDLAGNVTGLNAIAEALTGWKESEAIGRPLTEIFRIVNETTREPVDNPALRALREGCIVGLANHTVLIAKDGFERPIEDSAAPIRDADGNVFGSVLVFRDVTRDRRAAQALRAIEARRAAMLDSAIDGIVAIDARGEIIDFNPAAERMFGYSRRDAVGRELVELLIPSLRRDAYRGEIARIVAADETETPDRRMELVAVRADGSELPVEVSIGRAQVDGEPILVGYLRDVSEAKRIDRERTFFADLAAQTQPLEDPQELTQTAARLLAEHLDVDRCAYAEIEDEQLFVITGDYTRGVPSIVGRWPVEDFGAECVRSMLADEPYVVEDSEDDPRIGSQDIPAYRATNIRAVICVPLLKGGRFTAAMAVHTKVPRQWTDHEIAFVRTVVNRCWEALERSRIVRRLRESEERYRSLVTATAAIVWDGPAQGEFETPQPDWAAFTGQTFSQYRGWGWIEAVHPDDRQETASAWHRALEASSMYAAEHRLRRKDGEYRDMSVRAIPMFDESGAIRQWVGAHTDVTELKRAEKALKEAKERLATTLATAEVGTWEVDVDTQLVVADALLARVFGVPEEQALAGEVVLSRFLDAIHPDDRPQVERDIGRSLETGEPYETEYRVRKEDGSYRWVIARGARPRPGRLAGVLIDVTARKRAEEALRTSDERYRTLFETMDEGFAVVEVLHDEAGKPQDYRFIEVNPAFETHTGLRDAAGKTALELVPGQESFWPEVYGEVARTGEPVRFVNEERALRRWYDVHAFRIGGDGSRRVALLFKDITARKIFENERREYEERFRTLVEQVEDYAIFMIDLEGRPTSWNEGVRRVLGFSEEEFLGVDVTRTIFLPEDVAEGIPQRELKEAARTGSANNDRWMRRKDGSPFYAMGVTNALRDEGDELVGYLKVMRDQTERKQMEDELRRVNADLAQTDRRKDEFLATLAHELRNPLAPIRAGLDLLKLSADDPQETAEVVNVMERQAQQMMRLIDDLLEVSRITQGKLELRTCPVNLGDVIKSAVDAARPFVDEAGHALSLSLPDEPIRLEADPHRLQQVFANLLNNAAKYTPEGGRIEIAAERQNGHALVRIRDDGIGIPPEMGERIFEMFAQIDRSMERGYSGLGIGLTLVKRLVEMHGGQVEAHSEGTGKGSEFVVRLPVNDLSAKTDDGPAPAGEETSGGLKTLVVDDNRPAADTLAKILRILGNDVRTAYDGREAVDAAEEWRPDVILMDLGMPRMNGYEATREIRSREWGRDLLIVALTGWGQEDDRRRTEEAGFDRHLVKPVEPATLRRIFAEARSSRTG